MGMLGKTGQEEKGRRCVWDVVGRASCVGHTVRCAAALLYTHAHKASVPFFTGSAASDRAQRLGAPRVVRIAYANGCTKAQAGLEACQHLIPRRLTCKL